MSGSPAPFGAPAISMPSSQQLTGSLAEDEHRDEEEHQKYSAATSETTGKPTYSEENSSMGADQEQEVVALARRVSAFSRRSSTFVTEDGSPNPFLHPERDPTLDPNSPEFNVRRWVKSILHVASRDPERYPSRTAGVSFRNMNVHGYGTAADYQANVGNSFLKAAGAIKGLFGLREKVRIDILRNFEGLVKSGEMLVVLGRPGR
jgi:ATP-binding cassette subfamily G (WHITE) protein 2 (PDR)